MYGYLSIKRYISKRLIWRKDSQSPPIANNTVNFLAKIIKWKAYPPPLFLKLYLWRVNK